MLSRKGKCQRLPKPLHLKSHLFFLYTRKPRTHQLFNIQSRILGRVGVPLVTRLAQKAKLFHLSGRVFHLFLLSLKLSLGPIPSTLCRLCLLPFLLLVLWHWSQQQQQLNLDQTLSTPTLLSADPLCHDKSSKTLLSTLWILRQRF